MNYRDLEEGRDKEAFVPDKKYQPSLTKKPRLRRLFC